MSEALERIARVLEALDQRMSAADNRALRIEGHLTDGALAAEEISSSLLSIAASLGQLSGLAKTVEDLSRSVVELQSEVSQNTDVMQNFIRETQRLRTTSQSLISEVRRKEASG